MADMESCNCVMLLLMADKSIFDMNTIENGVKSAIIIG